MRAAAAVLAALLLIGGALGVWWVKFDRGAPDVRLTGIGDSLGNRVPLEIEVRAPGPGLRAVSVRLRAAGSTYELLHETVPATSWRGSGVTEKQLRLEPDLDALGVPEGPATLEVLVDTYGWRLGWGPAFSRAVTIDRTPPHVELLTTQHNMRLGGVELVVFRQSADTAASGVEVGPYFFPAVTGYFAEPDVALAFFAVPQDLTADVRPTLVARDAAGNRREVALPVLVKARSFPERVLAIDDAFLSRKVPEIERAAGLPASPDLLKGYLFINGELRRRTEARIRELTARSAPEPRWSGAFRRQPNAAPLSAFADRRIYTYRGETIDRQTHLGYDLASLRNAPVEAAERGTVVFAGYLGIYGESVILDHGLGIFTLYSHLSSIAVRPGEEVEKGQVLGRTGETGLAGGDHLHFSTMLWGVHVDPVEWWDGGWLKKHIAPKLALLPRAQPPAAAAPTPAAPAVPAAAAPGA